MPRTRRLRNVRRLMRWINSAVERLHHASEYSAWRRTEGEIHSVKSGYLQQQPGTEVGYSYYASGDNWSGSSWISFNDLSLARLYADLRPPGAKVIIRYNPAIPNRSVMLEADQTKPYPVAVEMQRHATRTL